MLVNTHVAVQAASSSCGMYIKAWSVAWWLGGKTCLGHPQRLLLIGDLIAPRCKPHSNFHDATHLRLTTSPLCTTVPSHVPQSTCSASARRPWQPPLPPPQRFAAVLAPRPPSLLCARHAPIVVEPIPQPIRRSTPRAPRLRRELGCPPRWRPWRLLPSWRPKWRLLHHHQQQHQQRAATTTTTTRRRGKCCPCERSCR